MVNKTLFRKWLFEQKQKQWSTKYYSENDFLSKKQTMVNKILYRKLLLSKNTNNGEKNTIQKTTIWAKTKTMVNKILYRKLLFEQKHKKWSTKYYTENDYLIVFFSPLFVFLLKSSFLYSILLTIVCFLLKKSFSE